MAAGDDLKLPGLWASLFVTRVKLALSFKGLSFKDVEEDLGNKSELLLSSNPVHKKVRVLLYNGKPICESVVIVQYTDEAFVGTGPSFLSSDPHECVVARFWAAYIDDKSFRGKTEEDKSEGINQTFAAVETLEEALRECSKGEGYFGGDSVATEVMSGAKIFDPIKTPLLAAWVDCFGELDCAKAALLDVDRVVEFAKKRQAQAAAAAAALEN
ncbi:unnamed protein product [Alopecurus aequalis]